MTSSGGYQNLIAYQLAVQIFDLTNMFCKRYINLSSRTYDQMIQAARSGKQNIVEGSLSKSTESLIKLTSVARASFGELLEDYKDFLRAFDLELWTKEDNRVKLIRLIKTNKSNWTNSSYRPYLNSKESFSNLMITLCYKESFLLDRLLEAWLTKFIKEGGFRENLYKRRIEYKSRQLKT